ncbi:tyrosine-type recombinase/integrase [Paenibacillus alvei]|uniref:Site-specific integrase n=1 Tax=Paenibacillus alvei TaxID=44250 RepID=A0AAP7A0J8_PAEAL|nr:site-specific integrase [Paenibacillus alvei]NOJ73121.1 site-specific integrase [Paenibacillus alvei]
MNKIIRESRTREIHQEILKLKMRFGQETLSRVLSETLQFEMETVKQEDFPFEDACKFFLESSSFTILKQATKKSYRSELDQYIRHLKLKAGIEPSLKQAIDPKVFLPYLEAYKGNNTHAKKCAFLRKLFRVITKHYFNDTDEELLKMLPVTFKKKRNPKWFSKIQFAELLSLSQNTNIGHRNYAILWTLVSSGIRLSELCNLTIADINVSTQTLSVKVLKRRGYVTEYERDSRKISKLGLTVLMDYIEFKYNYNIFNKKSYEVKGLYVFSKDGGKNPLAGRTVEGMIDLLIRKAKSIPEDEKKHYSTHSTRHTFAMYGLESGLDIFTISRLLGHSSIKSTDYYLNLKDDQMLTAINSIDIAKEEFIKMEARLNNL